MMEKSEIEKKLGKIWKTVFNLDQLSPEDDFFEMGGDSIIAIQMISMAEEEGISFSIGDIFQSKTLSNLVLLILARLEKTLFEDTTLSEKEDFYVFSGKSEDLNNVEDIYPLSPTQAGLFFSSLQQQETDLYCIQEIVYVENLDVEIFKEAWEKVFRNTSILRSCVFADDVGMLCIHKNLKMPFFQHDFSRFSKEVCDQKLSEFLLKDRKQGFHMQVAPLFRVNVIKLSPHSQVVVWSFHHIILDGWSFPIVFNDVLSVYHAMREKKEIKLKKRDRFKEYMKWIKTQDLNKARDFWKSYFSDDYSCSLLPISHQNEKDNDVEVVHISISEEILSRLSDFSKSNGFTLNTVCLGALVLVLSKFLYQKEVIVGVTLSGRMINLSGVNDIVGVLINTLPMKVCLYPDKICDFLSSVQRNLQEISAYGYISLGEIQSVLGKADLLFNVLFVYENYPVNKQNYTGYGTEVVKTTLIEKTEYPLTVEVHPDTENGFSVQFHYKVGMFSKEFIEGISRCFEKSLESLYRFSHLSSIELISENEKSVVKKKSSGKTNNVRRERSISEIFKEQVDRFPRKVAIFQDDLSLTYQELDARSNGVAEYLLKFAKDSDLIAISMDRCPDVLVSIFGILKAGKAFLPIDPSYPDERVSYILADSKVNTILTNSRSESRLKTLIKSEKISIVLIEKFFSEKSTIQPIPIYNLSAPAYVIYTSGSTGLPKGVAVEQSGAVNHLLIKIEELKIDENTILAQTAKLSFDVSVWQFVSAVLAGGQVVVVSDESVVDVKALLRLIYEKRITILEIVPALFAELVFNLDREQLYLLESLKLLILTGEVLKSDVCRSWLELTDNKIPLLNAYGPTECSDDVTHYFVRNESDLRGSVVPIGHPLDNLTVAIMDEYLSLAPDGAVGEICVYGVGVGQCYINRPELTAEKFVANPFGNGDRMYRTGDIGRYISDNCLEYLGRIDTQVKIRGQRIELGEIEVTISSLPGIKASAVVYDKNKSRLVAYVVPDDISKMNMGDFLNKDSKSSRILSGQNSENFSQKTRNLLWKKLPDYCVPNLIIGITSIPMTLNGKTNYRDLLFYSQRLSENIDSARSKVELPCNGIESMVLEIWKEVLLLNRIDINDNFFAIGGHSILATRIIFKIRDQINLEVPIRAIFEYPTVRLLSDYLENLVRDESHVSTQKLKLGELKTETTVFPLSFSQEGIWITDKLLQGIPLYNVPIAFRLDGHIDYLALEKAFSYLIRKHSSLRTSFIEKDGSVYQEISVPWNISIHIKETTEKDIIAEIRRLSEKVFDLRKDRLLRANLLKVDEKSHILVIVMHHIITDGASESIFLKELGELYSAFKNGEKVELPSSSGFSYGDYSLFQRSKTNNNWSKDLEYWRSSLSKIPGSLNLPFDYQRPHMMSYSGATYYINFGKDLYRKILLLANRHNVTVFMVMLAAVDCLLYKYSGQSDIVVGTPMENRVLPGTENIVGCFVNSVAISIHFARGSTFRDILHLVKESVLSAFEHQSFPFEILVDELSLPKRLNVNPIFQVMFVFNREKEILNCDFADLKIREVYYEYKFSKFDLTFEAIEKDESLIMAVEYSTELFEKRTIEKLVNNLNRIITQIVAEENDE